VPAVLLLGPAKDLPAGRRQARRNANFIPYSILRRGAAVMRAPGFLDLGATGAVSAGR
jgi:hypothetical protein